MDNQKIQRYKDKANIFLNDNISAFIENFDGDYFFCEILEVSDNYIIVKGFAGNRNGETDRIFFIDVKRFEEYEEKVNA